MVQNKQKQAGEKSQEELIWEGWKKISGESCIGSVSEEDKSRLEKAKFSEEQAKKTSFILGEPIKRLF